MNKKGRARERGEPPREKTAEQRRRYRLRIGSAGESDTSRSELDADAQAFESTTSRPRLEEGIQVQRPPAVSRRTRVKWPGWGGITAILTALALLGGIGLFLINMKTEIATNTATIKSLEKSHESLITTLRHEIGRVEAGFERSLAQAVEYLRRGFSAPAKKEAEKPSQQEPK